MVPAAFMSGFLWVVGWRTQLTRTSFQLHHISYSAALAEGVCRALLGQSYAVDTFLAACPCRGKEKRKQDSCAKTICNLVTSHWHRCRGDAKGERKETGEWRDQGKAWWCLSISFSQVSMSMLGGEDELWKAWSVAPASVTGWASSSGCLHHLVPSMSPEDKVTPHWAQNDPGIISTSEDVCPMKEDLGGLGGWLTRGQTDKSQVLI